MSKNILIIGGTSGIGLELAKIYSSLGHAVFATGRKNLNVADVKYINFPISSNQDETIRQADKLLSQIEKINMVIYSAGFYQEGRINELSDSQITEMINVGLLAPALVIKRLKNNPGKPLEITLITSCSGYTPRELEPIYAAVKAGLGMLGASLSLDPELGKVLVAAPSGTRTHFWDKNKDTSKYLDPKWVAEQIIKLSSNQFKYCYAKILRNPKRIEIVETRE